MLVRSIAAAHLGAEYLERCAQHYSIRMQTNLEKLCNQRSIWCRRAAPRHRKYLQQACEAREYDRGAIAATMWQMPGQVHVGGLSQR